VEINDDITWRIDAASATFGRQESRPWEKRGIHLSTTAAVYNTAVVMATLLYGCESWTNYRRHVCCLDQFHMCCLRHIATIKWQDRMTNTEVLKRCKISVSPQPQRNVADGKVLQQPSLQIQDPLLAIVADNSLQEFASSVRRGYTGSTGKLELIRRSDWILQHHVHAEVQIPLGRFVVDILYKNICNNYRTVGMAYRPTARFVTCDNVQLNEAAAGVGSDH